MEVDPSLKKGSTVLCPACRNEKALLDDIYGVLPGENCLAKSRGYKLGAKLKEPIRTLKHQLRIDRQREKHYGDLLQPWQAKKGELSKGLQPNPEYIKHYKNNPKALQHFTKEELKKSGF
jgi:hypothetical protein